MNHPHERYQHLLVKAVDKALTPQEQSELAAHLETCPSCAEELKDFQRIKETTDAMTARIMMDARIESPRPTALTKLWFRICFTTVLLGFLLLGGFGIHSLFASPETPLVIKVGTGLISLGGLGLLAYVLRLKLAGKDPYEEIDQ